MASASHDRSKKSVIVMQSELFSHEGELVWSVSELSQFKSSSIASNEFSIVPCCKITWEIQLNLGNDVGTTNIEVRRKDAVRKPCRATIQCSFENSKGEAYKYYFLQSTFISGNSTRPSFLPHVPHGTSDLNWNFTKCSHDDLLIVRCEIKQMNCCTITKTIEKGEYKTSLPRSPLSMDLIRGFERLYKESLLTDVEIKVSRMSFLAHKVILCIRSPVLQNMLESDMIESRSGVIKIEDAQPKIVEAFLSFLYTDTIAELSIEEIRELYAVAHKYQVESLQDKCSLMLLENISVETVCMTLKLSNVYNDDTLKEAAAKYIHAHFPSLQRTSELKSLRDNDPGLFLDIILGKCE